MRFGEYPRDFPGNDLETVIWDGFRAKLEIPVDDTGANKRNNPVAPSHAGRSSLTALVSRLKDHEYNILGWSAAGLTEDHGEYIFRELEKVRGIGPKIAAFFLRDVAFAFEADEKLESAPYFQPIDRWTRRGAHVFAGLMERPKPATDNESAEIIVRASIAADRRPSLINAGLWVFGALFARTEEAFEGLLKEPIALRRFLESRQHIFDEAVRATRGSYVRPEMARSHWFVSRSMRLENRFLDPGQIQSPILHKRV